MATKPCVVSPGLLQCVLAVAQKWSVLREPYLVSGTLARNGMFGDGAFKTLAFRSYEGLFYKGRPSLFCNI